MTSEKIRNGYQEYNIESAIANDKYNEFIA